MSMNEMNDMLHTGREPVKTYDEQVYKKKNSNCYTHIHMYMYK